MSRRIARWLAWSLFALTAALGLGTIPLFIAVTSAASAPGTPFPQAAAAHLRVSTLGWIGGVFGVVVLLAFPALGALIVSRYPTHAIGWLFCAFGVEIVAEGFAGYYAVYALFIAPGALPLGLLAGWFQSWIWVVGIAIFGAFLPLRFPTGRLVSRRWRPAWWLAVGATVAGALVGAFLPSPLSNLLNGFDVPNPLGVAGLGAVAPVLVFVVFVPYLASILAAVASLVVRLGRARGVERQQIKWFAYCAMLFALLFVLQTVVNNVLGISSPAVDLAWTLGTALAGIGLPVATGLSILRYRLFDIDVLIRRTLVYGTLTATLAGVYVGVVIAGQAVVQALTGQREQPPLVIVASTLLVAALVTPLRRGIQAAIDRRFYRRKVDAERTLAAFGATLRNEVELERVRELTLAVVEETMQPAHAALWLRVPPTPPPPPSPPAAAHPTAARR